MKKALRFALSAATALCLCATADAADERTIFVVRHAEKAASGGNDPELSEAGRARADALDRALRDAKITAIYATEFKRTQQTAAPLANRTHLETTIVPAASTAALIEKIRATAGNLLVVGHGNTIPDLLRALGIETPVSIGDNDYDNLWIVTGSERPRVIQLHYR